MASRQMAVPESALTHMRLLLDGLWGSDEPEPTPHELVALLSLTEMMGETEAAYDAPLEILFPRATPASIAGVTFRVS